MKIFRNAATKVAHSSKTYYETQSQHAKPNDATVTLGSKVQRLTWHN